MEKYLSTYQRALNSTPERMLVFLKMRGPQSAAVLSKAFEITNEGARLHLKKLMDDGLVESEKVSKGVGRPTVLYGLSAKGYERFPNTHAELTVQLLSSIKGILGQDALDQLIAAREQATTRRYEEALGQCTDVEDKLNRLVEIRSEEGYMAEWEKDDEGYLLMENHCPICAAATECQGFCRAELNTFRLAMGNQFQVDRTEHIVKGERRCSYRVKANG
ncbi:helix-turn-helix transcriptional regulator [Mangrovibacterium diazotrophicum]|uniref:Putative ArsR family transcriptional regulator n=1 Tax=Mangrovibacterium diazotrophicum TaxID=1261403 RepID=A0A419WB06_9BACT|nr:metalloregulator ArsR/SmtB family transcription factor [Mangrovibacterium diazotrophicum]RKD92604.1 putative ArsR family transcriptional regulator [Mangrovibacterium diazotrophicum]